MSAAIDFVLVDAMHQCGPTIDHFSDLLPHLARGAVVVLEDADWRK